jgi:hypothetical protein
VISGGLTIVAVALWLLIGLALPPDGGSRFGRFLRNRNATPPSSQAWRKGVDKWLDGIEKWLDEIAGWLGLNIAQHEVLKKLIYFFSDQQLVTGVALLITAQVKICNMSKYHYETTLILATISCSVHSATLIVLRNAPPQSLFQMFRIGGLFLHYALTILTTYKVRGSIKTVQDGDPRWPIRCFYSDELVLGLDLKQGYPLSLFNLILFVIAASNILSLIILIRALLACELCKRALSRIPTRRRDNQAPTGSYMWMRILSLIFSDALIFTFSLACFVIFTVWIFKVRAEMKPYLDGNEDDWGFGQIMSNLLLVTALYKFLDAISGMSSPNFFPSPVEERRLSCAAAVCRRN